MAALNYLIWGAVINLKNNEVGRFITFEGGEGGKSRKPGYYGIPKSIGEIILTRAWKFRGEIRELIVSGT